MSYFLNLEIKQDVHGIHISQKKYEDVWFNSTQTVIGQAAQQIEKVLQV